MATEAEKANPMSAHSLFAAKKAANRELEDRWQANYEKAIDARLARQRAEEVVKATMKDEYEAAIVAEIEKAGSATEDE